MSSWSCITSYCETGPRRETARENPLFCPATHAIPCQKQQVNRHLGYEKVNLPLYKMADTPFHIQEDEKY